MQPTGRSDGRPTQKRGGFRASPLRLITGDIVQTFEEYINSLEGRDDLNPLTIARDLHAIYQNEIGIRDAKIDEITGTLAEKEGAITVANDEIKSWKAKNFDLAMQIPGGITNSNEHQEDADIDGSLTIDDLFVK